MVVVVEVYALIAVAVLAKEPEAGDDDAAEDDEQHFGPLVLAFVELGDDDFAAGHVDEGAARDAQEHHVDQFVALRDRHPNDDAKRGDEGENDQEEGDLFEGVAGVCEGAAERNGSGRLVDEDSCGQLPRRPNLGLQAEGDPLEEGVGTQGQDQDDSRSLADTLFLRVVLILELTCVRVRCLVDLQSSDGGSAFD